MSLRRGEAEVLRRRSLDFLAEAEHALSRGSHDIACFLAGQSLQLYLKYVLLVIAGDYPRTHSVRQLLGEIARITGSSEIVEFMRANRARLIVLEDSRLMARYFVKEYSEEDAEDAIRLVRELVKLLDRALGGGP